MALATLGVVVLDCPDPRALAGFYAEVLGGTVEGDGDCPPGTFRSTQSPSPSTVPPSTSA